MKLARIAGHAHGVATRAELLTAGLSVSQIDRRVASGLLIVEFRGVYRVGHRAPSPAARYMAAVKACGPGATLSGLAAAWLWALIRGPAPTPEVSTATERRIPGILTRRCRNASPKDSTQRHGIPVTTAPATLLAIARGDAPTILSRLEKAFRALLLANRLSLPETNRPHGAGYVDCRWPGHRLTVEREARARGDEFRRYTWRDVVEDPQPTVRELRRLLGAV